MKHRSVEDMAGNWRRFESFSWRTHGDLPDPEAWAIYYTHNRDSGCLARSNARVFARELERFTHGSDPDVRFESHGHWAVGWIEGFAFRVTRNGETTEAAKKAWELISALEEYPILDESDFSDSEEREKSELWARLSLKERVRLCQEHGANVFAARHDHYPDNDGISEYLSEVVS